MGTVASVDRRPELLNATHVRSTDSALLGVHDDALVSQFMLPCLCASPPLKPLLTEYKPCQSRSPLSQPQSHLRTLHSILAACTQGSENLHVYPLRLQVYLTTLEVVKASCTAACERARLSPTETAALCNGVGGAVASLATQSVIVPIDVVRTLVDAFHE